MLALLVRYWLLVTVLLVMLCCTLLLMPQSVTLAIFGLQLTDKQATLLAERVQDFVVFCEPKPCIPTEWGVKSIHVSNVAHPQWTVLTVEGEPERQGAIRLIVIFCPAWVSSFC